MARSESKGLRAKDAGFLIAVTRLLRFEGAYSNDPDDPGGETAYGISQVVLTGLNHPTPASSLSLWEALAIYHNEYWTHPEAHISQISELSIPLAVYLFDCAVLQGRYTAGTILQRALNFMGASSFTAGSQPLLVDGLVGPKTLTALRGLLGLGHEEKIIVALASFRSVALADLIAANLRLGVFRRGWFDRVWLLDDLTDEDSNE